MIDQLKTEKELQLPSQRLRQVFNKKHCYCGVELFNKLVQEIEGQEIQLAPLKALHEDDPEYYSMIQLPNDKPTEHQIKKAILAAAIYPDFLEGKYADWLTIDRFPEWIQQVVFSALFGNKNAFYGLNALVCSKNLFSLHENHKFRQTFDQIQSSFSTKNEDIIQIKVIHTQIKPSYKPVMKIYKYNDQEEMNQFYDRLENTAQLAFKWIEQHN